MSGPIVHGGGVAAAAAIHGGRPEDWLDLSTGINPCPPDLPEIPARAWHRLPDRELEEAARKAARQFYRSGTRLPLPVPGTQAAIQMLPRLIGPGRVAAIVSPTYGEYARAFDMAGIAVEPVASIDQVNEGHGLVVVVNPNNPTGNLLLANQLLSLANRMAAWGGLLVVDEAFGDCEIESSVTGAEAANLVVFRSFGKFFGMAGLRLGFVIADPDIIERMASWLGPWSVSGPALSVATSLFSLDPQPIHEGIAERWAGLYDALTGAGLEIIGGAGLFALVEDNAAAEIHEHLCRAHILTRKFDYAPTWLRFGLAPDAEGDARLADALYDWRSSRG